LLCFLLFDCWLERAQAACSGCEREWDAMGHLASASEALAQPCQANQKGVYGKLQTLSAPNCPKVYTTIATSTPPEGIMGFMVAGLPAM
jgi:hypothetical protein